MRFVFQTAENIVGKMEKNAGNQHFSLFPTLFFLDKSEIFSFRNEFNSTTLYDQPLYLNHHITLSYNKELISQLSLSQTSPGFYVSGVQVLKTLWEKEKLLITSNFSFSNSVFYQFGELFIFIKIKIVVCKVFQFGRV